MSKMVIVGMGDIGSTLAALANKGLDDVVVISPEEAKQLAFENKEPFIIKNPYHIHANNSNSFICKGKHQYTEQVKNKVSIWICQCGRKLNH